jgi:hypothetical protein
MISGGDSSGSADAGTFVVGLSAAMIASYFGLSAWLGGYSGCGPSRASWYVSISEAAPFALPILAGAGLVALGRRRDWSSRVVFRAVVIAMCVVVVGEFFVFIYEFGIHHCGE